MTAAEDGRSAPGSRPLFFWLVAALLAAAALSGQVHAMWAKLTDAELLDRSAWVVAGEWVGQAPVKLEGAGGKPAELGAIAITEVLRGPAAAGVAYVLLPAAGGPVSSTDLSFRRGDRGLWFLRERQPGESQGPFVIDHPQRFLRDSPENAAAIASLRKALQPRR